MLMLPVAFLLMVAGSFESDVLPVFRAKCFACHSAKLRSGGLSLESRDDILRGGKSGGVIVPGKPVDSLLLTLVATGKMPMGAAKLSVSETAAIRTWIEREDRKAPVSERDVTAILSAKCWVCHGRRETMAGLDLRTRESMLRGGKSGRPVIASGKPEDSLLIRRIVAQEMPPPKLQEQYSVRGLTDDELAKVRQWILDGVRPDNEKPLEVSAADDTAIKPKDREFWSFRTPVRPAVTPPRFPARNAIDVLTLEKKPLAPEANDLTLMRRAYRRPVTTNDLAKPLAFYRDASAKDGFEAGIEAALSAVLVSPEFLFRVERDPEGVAANTAYPISDLTLASRLSFFLWSSIPDDELLGAAERGELHKPRVLEKQVRRMLAEERALNLVRNFGEQWLHLRNLESVTPDLRLFPDFDDNLRQAFRRETELHFETVLREDRSVMDLLKADYTFLNERLARHYGIPNVHGSQFRRVALGRDSVRGGLLRHGSVLTVTSYATRTSPVLRGKWILDNLLGTPPSPPPPNVPNLKENTIAANLSVRERLAEHRANAQCASCHNLIDPPGFALENFDAVGRWRTLEEGKPVDAAGGLPDGNAFDGVAGLEAGLLKRPELFASALTEKLLTFALGRGVEHYDAPAVRKIVREAAVENYRLSSIVVGIVKSAPFTMRKSL